MLRAFCWLVSNVVSMLGLIIHRSTRDWHTDAARKDQPPMPTDTHNKEPHRTAGLRPAVDAQRRDHSCCATLLRHDAPQRATSPGSAGGGRHAFITESSLAKGGGGGSPRLRGETEGAVFTLAISRIARAGNARKTRLS